MKKEYIIFFCRLENKDIIELKLKVFNHFLPLENKKKSYGVLFFVDFPIYLIGALNFEVKEK